MVTLDDSFLDVFQAQTSDDFEEVRRLRNLGAEWFEYTGEITREQQEQFRRSFIYPIWLYRRQDGQIVGYGFVSPRADGRGFVSLAVDPKFRGHGYGTMIYRNQRSRWVGAVWAYIRADNIPSVRSALAAGYVQVESNDDRLVLLRGDHISLPNVILDNG